jgi:hypothetical protein
MLAGKETAMSKQTENDTDGPAESKVSESLASKGGKARAAKLSPERRSEIARGAALAKAAAKATAPGEAPRPIKPDRPLKATHRGSFKDEFGFDVECYVLDDDQKTPVISKRGMSVTLGLTKGGSRLASFIGSDRVAPFVGRELTEKLDNPLIFQWAAAGASDPLQTAHGYDATILIDICKVISAASAAGVLQKRHRNMVKQASIILHASAKNGIRNLVYALAGYDATRAEVIKAFKIYVEEEAREYEKEFPDELYEEWYRLYDLPKPERNKPWKFKNLTIDHVYKPLAQSNGRILELTRAQKAKSDDRRAKLHQFLSDIGVKALRTHLGRLLGMAEGSKTVDEYERLVQQKFGVKRKMIQSSMGW